MKYKVLSTVNSPDDVKKLSKDELSLLCDEIRHCLIHTVSKNGGHLASNLGTVELTVAMHRVFNSPEDSLLFDVGHQSYTHKLLTGRFNKFDTLRKEDGLSGFMNPDESIHDPYVSGHSSNCISAAYGIYKANALLGKSGTAVAVVGDGAMTGGMVYEALNNIGADRSKFIVILNDNEMSISKNVGAIARHLNKIRLKKGYHNFKFSFSNFLSKIPLIGNALYKFFHLCKKLLKNAIYHSNVFEGLGLTYLGPVDGHDIALVENVLNIAKEQDRPVLVHILTVKGKGYSFAESDPGTYHGVSNFNIDEGFCGGAKRSYSDIVGETLCELANDSKVCAITAAMTAGTGLNHFEKLYSDRFFDVGIAEEHAVTFAAGLAKGGMKPYFVVYSSFLQRSYDQLVHDVAISSMPIKLCIDRAGFVGEDGKTHNGLLDVAFLSSIPNFSIYSPASFDELKGTLKISHSISSPVAIRYPRGSENNDIQFPFTNREYDVFGFNQDTAAVSYGRVSYNVYSAVKQCGNADFIKLNKIYPFSNELLDILKKYNRICIFEEGIKSGGICEKLSSKLLEIGYKGKIEITAVDNEFVSGAAVDKQLEKYKLDANSIVRKLRGN